MRAFLAAFLAVAFAVVAGCAAPTRLNAQWLNPGFAARSSPGKVLVVGIAPDSTTRRVFEDLMVKELTARGADAVPSYRFVPADGAPSQSQLDAAVSDAGATMLLRSRIVGTSQNLHVAPGVAMGPAWGGPWGWPWGWGGGFYGGWWGGAYAAPRVWTDESVFVDTQLVDAATQTVVWSGSTTTTTAPAAQGTPQVLQQFVLVIVEAIAAARLI